MLNVRFRSGLLIALSGVALSACFDPQHGREFRRPRAIPSAGSTILAWHAGRCATRCCARHRPQLLPIPILPKSGLPQLSIWGAAPTQVQAGSRYEFQPGTSHKADGDKLRFTATGLPAWASIDAASGLVSGVPKATDAGQICRHRRERD